MFCEVVAYAAGTAAGNEDGFLKGGHNDRGDQQFGLQKLASIIKSALYSYVYTKMILRTF